MTFNATVLPTTSGPVEQRQLTFLDVQLSPISTAGPVARFLSGIFPNLQTITADLGWLATAPQGARYDEAIAALSLWEAVEALVPEFTAARGVGLRVTAAAGEHYQRFYTYINALLPQYDNPTSKT
ncbi:hypothetical protein DFH09DRAFT_1323975 [Mycena vulgaris]|nr:hypothetical protein DFH09DRAFT_1323975 [Mycena vulgaris]